MDTTTRDSRLRSPAESHPAHDAILAILDTLFQHHTPREFAIKLWDGSTLPAETGLEPHFTFVLTHPGALRRMFWPPGELTLAEAFLRGDFDIEGDIVGAMRIAITFDALTAADWLRLIRLARKLPLTDPPVRFEEGRRPMRLKGRPHSRERDRAAVTYHYDVGNDFYALFLGRWMAYSCAYFHTPQMDLDAAQAAKFEHICRKLRLRPGERLLDIGCGWGGLVVYAAEKFGVQATGITLSRPQAEYARQWIERAGLSGRAAALVRDYRDIGVDGPFDKIVSVGMAEHVGRARLPDYFRAAYRALKPGGLFLNHAIARQRMRPVGWFQRTLLQRGQFIQRYVFPDGELLPIHEMLAFAEESGFEVRDVESLREHYALTLRHWVRNLEANEETAVAVKDERTYRTWRLYMAVSAQGFAQGETSVYQALLSKSGRGAARLPLTRADLYRS